MKIVLGLIAGILLGAGVSAYASRNASGTYTLPTGNPVVSGTVISSTWANTTLSDLRSEMTDSLSRSGKGGMLAPLLCVAGAVSAPAWSFTSDPTSGVYRAGAGDLRMAVAGADKEKWTSSGVTITGDVNASGNANITGNAVVTGSVSGASASFSGGASAGTLGVSGTSTLAGVNQVGTSTFTGSATFAPASTVTPANAPMTLTPLTVDPAAVNNGDIWINIGTPSPVPAALKFKVGGTTYRIMGGSTTTNGTGDASVTVISGNTCVCSTTSASALAGCSVAATTLTIKTLNSSTLVNVSATVQYLCF